MSVLGPTLMKNATVIKFVIKQQIFARFTSTRHARDITSMYHSQICSKTPVFVIIFAGTLCHRKNGSRWHGQQEDRDHAGLAAVDDEAVVAEAPLGGRDGVAQRWATTWQGGWCVCRVFRVFHAFVVSRLSNCA